jgi:tetratricopeptide (TPR) repeat protein
MDLGHLPDGVLLRYAAELWESCEFTSAREHLGRCESCASRFDGYQVVAAAMRERRSRPDAPDVVEPLSRSRRHRFEERLAREDAEAEEALAGKLDSQFVFEYADVFRRKHMHTGGVVRLLTRSAKAKCDADPLFAFGLAQTAVAIATALPDGRYPAEGASELQGKAWIEYSTVCRRMGRINEAHHALDRACAAYEKLPFPEPALNLAVFARGILFWTVGRHKQALSLIRRSVSAFERERNSASEFDARQVEAVILHRQGNLRAARVAYDALYHEGARRRDGEMVARAAHNIGTLLMEAGQLKSAERSFEGAVRILDGLELRGRAARTRWGLGLVALADGDLEEAEARLRRVLDEMLALGMDQDVRDVRGDLARTLVALDRPEEADMIVRAQDGEAFKRAERESASPTITDGVGT